MKIEDLPIHSLRKLAEGQPPHPLSHLRNSDSAWKPRPKLEKPKYPRKLIPFIFEDFTEIHNSIDKTIKELEK